MPMNGWEFIILIVLAVVILGPDRLPEYAQKLARFVVGVRRMANDARGQLQDQLGPEYEDIDWRQYDPRQYDPRRIVREALLEPIEDSVRDVREIGRTTRSDIDGLSRSRADRTERDDVRHDDAAPEPAEGTPYDLEAT